MDRGANGIIAEKDVRVIANHTNMTADARDIDNHGIDHVPLVTEGGVALSTSCEEIIITH